MIDKPIELDGSQQTILFCVLDWGLGHASRSSVIISQLSTLNEVIIVSSGDALEWLKKRFPEHRFLELPSYDINYNSASRGVDMMRQSFKLLRILRSERHVVHSFLSANSVDLIISDHRWGCNSKKTKSIFLAHQLSILHKNPVVRAFANYVHAQMFRRFDEIWVPDEPNTPLSGKLSQNPFAKQKLRFIGPITHMKQEFMASQLPNDAYDIGIILSGPEPLRSELEDELVHLLTEMPYSVFMIRGTNAAMNSERIILKTWKVIDMGTSADVEKLIKEAKLVISRSGYSTIMDIAKSEGYHILIPTPGLPEQIYLANLHQKRKLWSICEQRNLKTKLTQIIGLSFTDRNKTNSDNLTSPLWVK